MIVYPGPGLDETRAAPVLRRMKTLLSRRKVGKISRRIFLFNWSRLRNELSRTMEYQRFVELVRRRDDYHCKSCGRSAGVVHHLRGVARYPDLALAVSNGEVRCDECHAQAHPHMRKAS